jgi:F-type H+-transporting ATPase subunit delta
VATETSRAPDLARRYAAALFELAEDAGILDAVASDLRTLQSMIDDSADLRLLIRSPVISRDEQGEVMTALAEKADLDDLTRRFVGVVARNRRLFVLPGIIRAFLAQLAAHRGETTAEVVAARKLTEKQAERLGASLKRAVGTDVAMNVRVDPGLLGGLIVRVGSRMIDSSLRTKLLQLRLAMKGIG